jgi:hypothetical protein
MFELSEAELQVLEELWKLIQTKCTMQDLPTEEVSNKTSWAVTQQLDDPLIEDRMRVLRHRFADKT